MSNGRAASVLSRARARAQVWSVQNIIHELAAGDKPQILALNKADAVLAQTESLPDGSEWMGIHELVEPKVWWAQGKGRG